MKTTVYHWRHLRFVTPSLFSFVHILQSGMACGLVRRKVLRNHDKGFSVLTLKSDWSIRNAGINRGQFAVVKKCCDKDSNESYAAKCIKKKRTAASKHGQSREHIEREASILKSLNHDGIIKLYDLFETRHEVILILELLTGGELFEQISQEEFILEKDACYYTEQILTAVEYLHDQNIVHLDLKPENIVLKNKDSKDIKLVDFGLAQKLEPDKEVKEMQGTPEFIAPEIITFDPVGPFTDMWSIGVIIYVLLSGASPFLGDDNQETYRNIQEVDYNFDEEYFKDRSEDSKDLVTKLLIKNRSVRYTVKECLDHPWFQTLERRSVIDTAPFRTFVARRRWKVSVVSRLRLLAKRRGSNEPPVLESPDEEYSNYFLGVTDLSVSPQVSDAESLLDDDEFVNDRTDEIKDKDNRSALTDGSNSLTTVTRLAKKETMGFINQSDNSDAGEYTEPTTTSDHSENMSLLTEVTKDLQEGDELQQVENLLPNAGREIRIILDGEANGNPLCFSNSNGGNALEGNSALEVAHTDWKKGNNINQENVDDFSITFNNTASSEKYNEPQKECQEPVVSVATLLEGSSNMNYDAKIMDGNQEQDRNLMSSSGLELEKPLLKHDLGNLKSMKTIKKSLEFLEIIDITGPEVETLTRDLNSNTINPLGPVVPDICKETSV